MHGIEPFLANPACVTLCNSHSFPTHSFSSWKLEEMYPHEYCLRNAAQHTLQTSYTQAHCEWEVLICTPYKQTHATAHSSH